MLHVITDCSLRCLQLIRRDYVANGGWETFLSYEDPQQDILVGLLRLRKCSPEAFREELKGTGFSAVTGGGAAAPSSAAASDAVAAPGSGAGFGVSIVRELHVYGTAIPVSGRDPTKFQHQGFGTLLMEEAARIAKFEHGSAKISVISGVGTRHYYRKLGYEVDGPYMSMML